MCRGSGSKKKSGGCAFDLGRPSSSPLAERVERDRQQIGDGDALDERRDELVVDEDDPVDLLADVRVGDPVGDRLGGAVVRLVAEPRPGLGEREPAEADRRLRLLADGEELDLLPFRLRLAHQRERPAKHLRVECAGEAAVARDDHDPERAHVLAPLEQRLAGRARRLGGAGHQLAASARRTAASPRSASPRGAAAPRRRAPSPWSACGCSRSSGRAA